MLHSASGQRFPKIEQDVSDSASDIKIMFESLKAEFKPFVDQIAPTIERMNVMQELLNAERIRLKDAEVMVVQMVEDNKLRDQQVKTAQGIVTDQAQVIGVEGQARLSMEAKIVETGTKIEVLYHDLEAQKRKQEVNYQQQQMQIATATTVGSTAGPQG